MALHHSRDTVSTQESEGNGKQDEVGHQHADDEKQIHRGSYAYGVFLFIIIQGRHDEAEQFNQNVG